MAGKLRHRRGTREQEDKGAGTHTYRPPRVSLAPAIAIHLLKDRAPLAANLILCGGLRPLGLCVHGIAIQGSKPRLGDGVAGHQAAPSRAALRARRHRGSEPAAHHRECWCSRASCRPPSAAGRRRREERWPKDEHAAASTPSGSPENTGYRRIRSAHRRQQAQRRRSRRAAAEKGPRRPLSSSQPRRGCYAARLRRRPPPRARRAPDARRVVRAGSFTHVNLARVTVCHTVSPACPSPPLPDAPAVDCKSNSEQGANTRQQRHGNTSE